MCEIWTKLYFYGFESKNQLLEFLPFLFGSGLHLGQHETLPSLRGCGPAVLEKENAELYLDTSLTATKRLK